MFPGRSPNAHHTPVTPRHHELLPGPPVSTHRASSVYLMLLGQSVDTGSDAPSPVGANIPVVSGEMLLFSHSVVLDSAAPWTAAYQAPLSFTISQSLLRFTSIESVMPSNHLILCCSLLFLPSIFPSIRVFSSESALHIRWSEYWSFSFSISFSKEYSGLISFRINWFDLLAVQGSLKSLLQHHNLKASVLWPSAFLSLGITALSWRRDLHNSMKL